MNIYPTTYYVYAYLRKSDGSPYYIGKGQGRRAWNKQHSVVLPTDSNRIVIIEENLTNLGACAIERRLIRWYGRKDLGSGILRNLTDGGEGVSSLSPESRKKISDALTGKVRTQKHIDNLKRSKKLANHPAWNKGQAGKSPNSHPCVFISPENIQYTCASIRQGCRNFNLSLKLMCKVLNGERDSYNGWRIKSLNKYKTNTGRVKKQPKSV